VSGPRVSELLPGVWTSEVVLPEFGVRSVALLGRERMLVFDTLLRPSDMQPFAGLAGGREIVTVYSHADWDHIWGTAGLPHLGREVVGHTACAERFRTEVPGTLGEKRAAEPRVWDDVELVPPTTLFGHRLEIDLDSWTVQLHHLPGHTRDSIVAWVPQLGLLLGGDAVEDPWPLSEEGLPLSPWIESLERWFDEPSLELVIPSHGTIAGRELLNRNILYLRALGDGRPYPVPEGTGPFYGEQYERDRQRYGHHP
jgi:glyoxylase-like metal-dependent hydrolase (beta-lactamase superfamily II)